MLSQPVLTLPRGICIVPDGQQSAHRALGKAGALHAGNLVSKQPHACHFKRTRLDRYDNRIACRNRRDARQREARRTIEDHHVVRIILDQSVTQIGVHANRLLAVNVGVQINRGQLHVRRDNVQITVNGVLNHVLVVGRAAVEQVGRATSVRHDTDVLRGVALRVAVHQQHALAIVGRQNTGEVYCGDRLADAAL